MNKDMEKTEYKVGEVFQCGLVKLKVEDPGNFSCEGCFLEFVDCYGQLSDLVGLCNENREDYTNVIFVKVEE